MCIYIKLTVLNGAKLTRLIVTMITVGNIAAVFKSHTDTNMFVWFYYIYKYAEVLVMDIPSTHSQVFISVIVNSH